MSPLTAALQSLWRFIELQYRCPLHLAITRYIYERSTICTQSGKAGYTYTEIITRNPRQTNQILSVEHEAKLHPHRMNVLSHRGLGFGLVVEVMTSSKAIDREGVGRRLSCPPRNQSNTLSIIRQVRHNNCWLLYVKINCFHLTIICLVSYPQQPEPVPPPGIMAQIDLSGVDVP